MALESGHEHLARIRPMLQEVVDRSLMAGAVAVIWRGGELALAEAVGWRDVATRAPMRMDTLFRIASMTKPVVSLAALMLMEEGRLRLEDPVKRWIPELADRVVLRDPAGPLDDVTPAARDITVEDLMTHRSGLSNSYNSTGPIAQAYADRLGLALANPMAPDAWLGALGGLPLSYEPGARFHYGASLDVLGFVLARLEGRPLGEILRRRIFEPLGMTDTNFWPAPDQQPRMARLYRTQFEPGPLQDISFPLPPAAHDFESGSGGLFSTPTDYLKFARLLLGRGEADGVRLVRAETVTRLSANRLTPAQREIPFPAVVGAWESQGFGLGVSMVLEPERHPFPASAGSFGWPGAFGTWWIADPGHDMALAYFAQDFLPLTYQELAQVESTRRPVRRALADFQALAYAALTDR